MFNKRSVTSSRAGVWPTDLDEDEVTAMYKASRLLYKAKEGTIDTNT